MNHISYIIFWSISITITHSNRSTNLPFETPSWLHVGWRHSTPRPLKPRLPTPASTAVHPLGSTSPNPAQLPGQRGSLEEKKMNTGKKRWLKIRVHTTLGPLILGTMVFILPIISIIQPLKDHFFFWAIALWFMTNDWKDWLMTYGGWVNHEKMTLMEPSWHYMDWWLVAMLYLPLSGDFVPLGSSEVGSSYVQKIATLAVIQCLLNWCEDIRSARQTL